MLSAKYNIIMKINSMAKKLGSLGGQARAKKLLPERKKEIASMGGQARAFSLLAAKRIKLNFAYVNTIDALRSAYEKQNQSH
ncbi:MAG: hypothetical protein ACD_62C00169G0015 [uncultured bacterium]|nr:MAG: hypothetical protein ACD_62C00169G0015 [uncultured bacterium]